MYVILPDDVIAMTEKESLFPCVYAVNHAHTSDKVHHLSAGRVVQVVTALVATVTVHPLQPQLVLRSRLVGHFHVCTP